MSEPPVLSREATPGLGHNHPPEPLDPIEVLDMRLSRTHREMVVRFVDLELGCTRVPNPLVSEADAAAATDFIAQCQAHIKKAETAHKREKEYFLKAGRVVDGFFRRRCTKLSGALVPIAVRLKAYRDQTREGMPRRTIAAEQADARALFKTLAAIGGPELVGPLQELDPGLYYQTPPRETER